MKRALARLVARVLLNDLLRQIDAGQSWTFTGVEFEIVVSSRHARVARLASGRTVEPKCIFRYWVDAFDMI